MAATLIAILILLLLVTFASSQNVGSSGSSSALEEGVNVSKEVTVDKGSRTKYMLGR